MVSPGMAPGESLGALLEGAQRAPGSLSATVPEAWLQGRTAYGGLSAMLALEAANSLADDLPPLRSASIAFVAPLEGDVVARAALVRRGRSTTFVDAEVAGAGGVGLKAGFVFAAERESAINHDDNPMPAVVDVDSALSAFAQGGPSFAPNFEWRHASAERHHGVPELLL